MRTIWKWPLKIADEVVIVMPEDAELLHVEPASADVLELWAMVESEHARVHRHISICGTGHPAPSRDRYVGTCVASRWPPLVWHVFDGGQGDPA